MKIRCKQNREGGTKIDLDGIDYHFVPDKNGDHVAEVTDKKHIGRLLSITEGYEMADGNTQDEPMIIKNDDEEIDLMALENPELLALAKNEFDLKANANWGAPKLREAIFAAATE